MLQSQTNMELRIFLQIKPGDTIIFLFQEDQQ